MSEQTQSNGKALAPVSTRAGVPVHALVPTNIQEGWQMAKYISIGRIVPSSYPGAPGSEQNIAAVFGAMQTGAMVGLPPMAAVSWLVPIDGRYLMYGDAQLAIVRDSGLLEAYEEYIDGDIDDSVEVENWDNKIKAVIKAKRKDTGEERDYEFSVADARRAKLWAGMNKQNPEKSPWFLHPKRMLRFRARAFLLRDLFGDVLLGLKYSVEEMLDMGELTEGADGVYRTASAAPPAPKRSDFGTQATVTDAKVEDTADQSAGNDAGEDPFSFTDPYGDVTRDPLDRREFIDMMVEGVGGCSSTAQLKQLLDNNFDNTDRLDESEFAEIIEAHDKVRKELDALEKEIEQTELSSEPEGGEDGSPAKEQDAAQGEDAPPETAQDQDPQTEEDRESGQQASAAGGQPASPTTDSSPTPDGRQEDLSEWAVEMPVKNGRNDERAFYGALQARLQATKDTQEFDRIIRASQPAIEALSGLYREHVDLMVEKRRDQVQ